MMSNLHISRPGGGRCRRDWTADSNWRNAKSSLLSGQGLPGTVSRLIRSAIPAGILALTFVARLAALNYGGLTSDPTRESDALVLWVLPLAKVIFNISAAGTAGTLVLTCTTGGLSKRALRRDLTHLVTKN